MRQRIRRLEEKCESLQEERIPLQEMLEEYNGKLHSSGEKDYQDYYISQIESCGVFMETVKRLLGEEPDMGDSAELRQMHDNSDNSEEMEGR